MMMTRLRQLTRRAEQSHHRHAQEQGTKQQVRRWCVLSAEKNKNKKEREKDDKKSGRERERKGKQGNRHRHRLWFLVSTRESKRQRGAKRGKETEKQAGEGEQREEGNDHETRMMSEGGAVFVCTRRTDTNSDFDAMLLWRTMRENDERP